MTSNFGSSGLTNLTVIDLFLKKTFTNKNKQTNPQSLFAGSFYLQVKMVLRPTWQNMLRSKLTWVWKLDDTRLLLITCTYNVKNHKLNYPSFQGKNFEVVCNCTERGQLKLKFTTIWMKGVQQHQFLSGRLSVDHIPQDGQTKKNQYNQSITLEVGV